jgi:translation elongation factor EF-1alpha
MKDKVSLHKKVQNMIDCYAATDPLKEMSELVKDKDTEEAAVKWLALSALHGINMNARKITVMKSKKGQPKVVADYRPAELPSPGPAIGERIIEAVREMTHLEKDKDKSILSLGIRDGSIDLKVKVKKDGDEEKVTLEFPE